MDLQKYEQKYYELKGKHASKVISDEEYQAGVKALKIKDSNGDWCRINETTGQWQVFDGDEWVQRQPLFEAASIADVSISQDTVDERTDADRESEANYEDIIVYVESYEDDPDDYVANPDALQGKMQELAEVDFTPEVRALMANASDKTIFDDEDLSTYEISRNPNFYDDQAQMMKTASLKEASEAAEKPVRGLGSKTIVPSVTGTPPKITSEMLSMFNVTKAVKATSIEAKKAKTAKRKVVKDAKTERAAAQYTCSKCSSPLKQGQKFCTKCGTSVEEKPPKGRCHKCGADNKENSKFCKMCGAKLNG